MYENYYGFTEKPFSLTPDPKYLYRSQSHAQRVRAAAVRHPPPRRLRRRHRRHRHRQDHAVPGAARADRSDDVHGARAEPVSVRRGSAQADPAGLRRHLARGRQGRPAGGRQQAGADRHALRLPARPDPAQGERRAHHRRSAEPAAAGARADPHPLEPRDRQGKAAADHPGRAARTCRRCCDRRSCGSSISACRSATSSSRSIARRWRPTSRIG